MKRAILTAPVLPPAALAELKQWLGIATPADDAPLSALLRAGLDLCEAFTGTMPVSAACEEVLPATSGWQRLSTRPVQAVTALQEVAPNGTRTTLAATAWAVELDADGTASIMLTGSVQPGARLAVRFTAGLAPDWAALPEPLRHGIVRLAAHQHRTRDDDDATSPLPPAAVAALWRPWRRMRLA